MTRPRNSTRRDFGAVVAQLLQERGGEYVTATFAPNWMWFSKQLNDVSYESLRKAVTGERHPGVKILEAVAAFFDVPPDTFWEWRSAQLTSSFDAHEVGPDAAFEALSQWEAAQAPARRRRSA